MADSRGDWKGAQAEASYLRTLNRYCGPIRDMLVADIEFEDVLAILRPIWRWKPTTAQKVRSHLELVFDAAIPEHRTKPNPARLKDVQRRLRKLRRFTNGHHRALDYEQAPAFWKALQTPKGMGAAALRLTILCG